MLNEIASLSSSTVYLVPDHEYQIIGYINTSSPDEIWISVSQFNTVGTMTGVVNEILVPSDSLPGTYDFLVSFLAGATTIGAILEFRSNCLFFVDMDLIGPKGVGGGECLFERATKVRSKRGIFDFS